MLKLYYYKHLDKDGNGNFGDELSHLIITKYYNTPLEHASPWLANMISIGSILDIFAINKAKHLPKYLLLPRKFHVWGSGLMFDKKSHFPWFMRFHAVRGKLTQANIGKRAANAALGDPGLLADKLLDKLPEKKYKFGIIPHYCDAESPLIKELHELLPNSTIINICDKPLTVLERIAECESIISTSLHGLIVSDSLGIPNLWISVSDNVLGGRYKFLDYYSVFNIDNPKYIDLRKPYNIDDITNAFKGYERPGLDHIKKALLNSFPFKSKAV